MQRFAEQVESSIDILDVTNKICKRHLSHATLSLPTANLLRVVIARSSSQSNLAAAADAFTATTTRALDDARSRSPLPHHTLQTLAATLAMLCTDTVPPAAAAALSGAMDAASGATMSSDDHEMASAFGTLSQCVIAVSALPPGALRVPELQQKGARQPPLIPASAVNACPAKPSHRARASLVPRLYHDAISGPSTGATNLYYCAVYACAVYAGVRLQRSCSDL